jgi:3-oxoacyl-[acyl-carrier protein] reductase
VSDEAQVEELFDAAEERLGRVGGVVNAAGILVAVPSAELALDDLRTVLETNVVGAFAVSRAALARMAPAGGGSIVQIASLSSFGGFPRRLGYAISKSGVLALTRTLGVEWARLGVRVNALAPGYVRTPISDSLVERGILDLDRLEERIPVGRRAEPEEMVGPALFLLGEESRYVTGECLVADGGWRAWVGPIEELPQPETQEPA